MRAARTGRGIRLPRRCAAPNGVDRPAGRGHPGRIDHMGCRVCGRGRPTDTVGTGPGNFRSDDLPGRRAADPDFGDRRLAAAAVPRGARLNHEAREHSTRPDHTQGKGRLGALFRYRQPAPRGAGVPYRPLAASTTASVVMLKYLYSSPAGAEAPKRSRPMTAPSRPTYLRQKSVMPASTATRLRTAFGSTDSR